jgi:hypothetical protein
MLRLRAQDTRYVVRIMAELNYPHSGIKLRPNIADMPV